jgi:DNA mismatch endonuclease (patch repair protein)
MDTLTGPERSERMARIRGKDSKPEMLVRRLVHAAGYRFRLHRRDLPGRPDLVFPGRRKIIFVHGCFWHQHPDPTCRLARRPKSRHEFWSPKFEANIARDERVLARLADLGWNVLIVWECELRDKGSLERALRGFLEDEIN